MFYSIVAVLKNGRIAQRNGYIIHEVVSSTDQRSRECPKVGTRLTIPELDQMYPNAQRFSEHHRFADYDTGEIVTIFN